MMKHLTVLIASLMMIGADVSTANQDSSPSNRPINYVCNGQTYIIVSTEAGWALLKQPDVEVSTTYDGFILVNRETGIEKTVGKSASGADVMYVYHENDTRRYDCVAIREQ